MVKQRKKVKDMEYTIEWLKKNRRDKWLNLNNFQKSDLLKAMISDVQQYFIESGLMVHEIKLVLKFILDDLEKCKKEDVKTRKPYTFKKETD